MKVKELIEVLRQVDPELPVVTYANRHTYHSRDDFRSHGPLKVGISLSGKDDGSASVDGVLIGNIRDLRFNYPNEWVGVIVAVDEEN